MSDIDPLIKREIQWMSLGHLENVDLAPMIIARVRRQHFEQLFLPISFCQIVTKPKRNKRKAAQSTFERKR